VLQLSVGLIGCIHYRGWDRTS